MSAEALYVLQHAGLLSINAIPGGRVGCHGQGGPFAQFFVRTSPADPTIIQFVPGKEPARCLRVVQTPEGALTLDALAVSPCHSPEGWFQLRIPSDGTPLRFGVCAAAHLESVLLPGHYLLASQDGRVLLVGGSAGATTFAIRSAAEAAPSPALVGARGGGFRLGVQRNLAAHAVAGGGGGGGVGAMAGLRGMLARVGLGRGGRGGRGGASARHQHAPRGPAVSTIAPRPLPPALKAALRRDGYVVLPGAVPRHVLHRALRSINATMGQAAEALFNRALGPPVHDRPLPPHVLEAPGALSPLHACGKSEPILALMYSSPVWAHVQALFGPGMAQAVHAGQVAPRFPKLEREPPHVTRAWYREGAVQVGGAGGSGAAEGGAAGAGSGAGAGAGADHEAAPGGGGHNGAVPTGDVEEGQGDRRRWHIDGQDREHMCPFSLLVGFMLSDLPEGGMGNFTVFPGSHAALASRVAEHGVGWLWGAEARESIGYIEPLEVTCRAGDVVLAHPLLAHRVGLNYSPHVRYAVFMRVHHREHERLVAEIPRDVWAEMPGVRAGEA